MTRSPFLNLRHLLICSAVLGSLHASFNAVAQSSASDLPESSLAISTGGTVNRNSQPLPNAPSAQVSATAISSSTLSAHTPAKVYSFPVASARAKAYVTALVGPEAFIGAAFPSIVDEAQSLKVGYPSDGYIAAGKHPAHGIVPEWGEGADGFAKRYASRFGMGLVTTTSRYGLGEALRQDVSYHRCECTGILPRTYHAITQSMIAHTRSGRSVPSLSALVSPFVGAEVATVAWYPSRYNVSDALRTSAPLYYNLAIGNLVDEFGKH
jgi:hypothetical protein